MKRKIIKGRTLDGDLAKIYVYDYGDGVIIDKYVLSKNIKEYGGYAPIRKQFKDYYLFNDSFAIKPETLNTINEWVIHNHS